MAIRTAMFRITAANQTATAAPRMLNAKLTGLVVASVTCLIANALTVSMCVLLLVGIFDFVQRPGLA